jgi:TatD DNase family protein
LHPFINIHTHAVVEEESVFILNLKWKQESVSAAFQSHGIHPWDCENIPLDLALEELLNLCVKEEIVAIGEAGIDRAVKIPLELQVLVFEKQLALAERFQLSVIIHCVRAWNDLLSIRKKGKYTTPWIFHGYNGNLQTARQIINSGCFLSFGKALLMKTKLQETFKALPLSAVFFETDDADIKIEEIYEKAGELYDICTEDLKNHLVENFNRIFKKNKISANSE